MIKKLVFSGILSLLLVTIFSQTGSSKKINTANTLITKTFSITSDTITGLKSNAALPKQQDIPQEYIKTRVIIHNKSSNYTMILLGESSDNLKEYKLEPMENWISPGLLNNPVFKVYTTEEKYSEYRLTLGNKYQLYYNFKSKK